eukprot:TRINITY_DN1436_c0_g1_i1.p1 TRINITY_DN1436_c0_g1~~TRINITY_DN1436_c0_g1_i1.p1  ORF type:complete len:305 (-),score=72.63 TRINITY_DN1436_c0_g1_i1:318-1232(-)
MALMQQNHPRGQTERKSHQNSKKGGPRGSSAKSDEYANKPIVMLFQNLTLELDERHDRYERIVKLSRDITIESKRIIFHLHRIQNVEEEENTLAEVEERLTKIRSSLWRQMSDELLGQSHFQFLRAYTGGLQEYIEARSFFHFLRHEELISWKKVQEELVFEASDEKKESDQSGSSGSLMVTVPRMDFILGIADLSGEIMRRVINSIGFGDTESCFRLTGFLHELYYGFKIFEGLSSENRELRPKCYVMLNSLKKCEAACYTINLRGSEIPKHMFAEILSKSERDEVESSKNTAMDSSSYYYDD